VTLSEIDRNLLESCLARKPQSWEAFVDRFLGLVVHVVHHTSQARSIRLSAEDREDLAADVFLAIIKSDFAVLRQFRGKSSLATYLTVVARRIVVRQLISRRPAAQLGDHLSDGLVDEATDGEEVEQRLSNIEEVQRMLVALSKPQAEIVRLYHLEGKTYQEIALSLSVPENSIGPTLSRARAEMRRLAAEG